jgi:hypothetical protein
MYPIEKIQQVLRCISDGATGNEAGRVCEVNPFKAREWAKKYKIHQNSFLSDQEILERISLYSEGRVREKVDAALSVFDGHPVDATPSRGKTVVDDDEDDDEDDDQVPAPMEIISPVQAASPPDEKPDTPIKEFLSEADQARLAKSIRLTLGDKALNDVHNGVVALVSATAERLKHIDNHEDAIKMVSSAIGLKQLLEVLEAPPMAMNWNDVSRIINIIREANDLNKVQQMEKKDKIPDAPTQVSVTILSQRPPKKAKTIDAEICDE